MDGANQTAQVPKLEYLLSTNGLWIIATYNLCTQITKKKSAANALSTFQLHSCHGLNYMPLVQISIGLRGKTAAADNPELPAWLILPHLPVRIHHPNTIDRSKMSHDWTLWASSSGRIWCELLFSGGRKRIRD